MSQSKQSAVRVYVRNGPTLRLSSVEGDPHAELRKVVGGAITGVDTSSGDRLSIRTEEVVSVATAQHVPDPAVLYGRRFEVRSAKAMAGDWLRAKERDDDLDEFQDEGLVHDMVQGLNADECAVLIAEDMASAIVVIYDLGQDAAVWVNPASSPDATEYQIQALKLLALGEAVEVAFQEEDVAEAQRIMIERRTASGR